MKKKLPIYSEVVYLLSNVLIALAVAMLTAADLGISMIVSPAYLISEKVGFLTFGQSEYVVQALLFVLMCVLLKKIKPLFFAAFGTCLLYGWILDLWRALVPLFHTASSEIGWPCRIVLFVIGVPLTSFAVALSLHTYLYPQVVDFFFKAVADHFGIARAKFKQGFDLVFLTLSLILSFVFFGKLVGIGVGTAVMALCNGWLIGCFSRWIEAHLDVKPLFPKAAKAFEM